MNKIRTLQYALFVTAIMITTLSMGTPLFAEQKPKSTIQTEIAAWNTEIEADRQNTPEKLKAWKEEVDGQHAQWVATNEAMKQENRKKIAALKRTQEQMDEQLKKFEIDTKAKLNTEKESLLKRAEEAGQQQILEQRMRQELIPLKRKSKATDQPPTSQKEPNNLVSPPKSSETHLKLTD